MTPDKIAELLSKRDRLLTRRDGLYDHAVIKRIEAQLGEVEPGVNNQVDLALGRTCAVLEQYAQRPGWIQSQAVTLEEMKRISADAMQNEAPIEY